MNSTIGRDHWHDAAKAIKRTHWSGLDDGRRGSRHETERARRFVSAESFAGERGGACEFTIGIASVRYQGIIGVQTGVEACI